MVWSAQVLTLLPAMFPGPLGASLPGQALDKGLWELEVRDIREHGLGKHHSVDDTPAGGGPGMVLRADVAGPALEEAIVLKPDLPSIYLSPRGRRLDQARVRELSSGPGVRLLCGRFEGLDERVIEHFELEEISLGDFVLAGGEIAAMALMEACVRLLPGVLGDLESVTEESFSSGLLEYPHYTRPRQWQGDDIPPVLLSGDHKAIAKWRHEQSEKITQERRPDLWAKHQAYKKDR